MVCYCGIYAAILFTPFSITLIALRQAYDCPSVSEVMLINMMTSSSVAIKLNLQLTKGMDG